MTCARCEAGARRPAPSTSADAPRRLEPRPGRSRARLFFLPALALLLGALLAAATPAAAQPYTVWESTLTVDRLNPDEHTGDHTFDGCDNYFSGQANCYGSGSRLTRSSLTYKGVEYRIVTLFHEYDSTKSVDTLWIGFNKPHPPKSGLVLYIDEKRFPLEDATTGADSRPNFGAGSGAALEWRNSDLNFPADGTKVNLTLMWEGPFPPNPTTPTLTPLPNATTNTTLSFQIGCVSGIVTDYILWVVGPNNPHEPGSVYFSPFAPNSDTRVCPVRATVENLSKNTTYNVQVRARTITGGRSRWSDPADYTTANNSLQGGGSSDPDRTDALTASFEQVPAAHDGKGAFDLLVRLSETVGNFSKSPRASSFEVTRGRVVRVEQADAGLWRVRVRPSSWREVGVTLAGGRDCDTEGAVCTRDIRALSNTSTATVDGPTRIRVKDARAKEGRDATLKFAVTLNRAASHDVSVDYETGDETATAGADYTATSGTLTFAAGETVKTVSVPVLDDAVDEGKETMRLLLTNPQGAYLRNSHRQAKGVIRNTDPLPKAYLGYFGRRAASDAVAAVTARFETPRGAGSHFTFAGQRLSGDGAALADTVAGLARAFGAEEATAAPGGDPFARHGLGDPWNDAASAPGRAMSARELLMGTSFRAVLGGGAGSQLTSWGQGASVSHFSGAAPGLSLSGEAATGALGMDYERGRLLTGFALTHSLGAGTAHGAGETYALGSSVTTVLPYARFALTERISAWTLAGTGSGGLTLDVDDAAQRHRTDLSMTLAAAGVRGDLVTPVEAGGFALALKADAFWVRTESESVRAPGAGRLAAARADATRLRAVLDGKRTFALAGGATLAPSIELGVRHDGGDAGTGTGVELGAGVGFTDPSRGLDMALRVYGLAAHAEDRHREWGVSGSVSLVPGGSGRGLLMSLTPSYGVDRGGAQRLWTMPDAHALAANDEAATASSRLDTELGYGLAVFGGGFTGTPNVGFGLSDGGGRDYRLGWRLTPAASGDTGFEVSLDATRRETANDDAEHGVMLRGLMRW